MKTFLKIFNAIIFPIRFVFMVLFVIIASAIAIILGTRCVHCKSFRTKMVAFDEYDGNETYHCKKCKQNFQIKTFL